MGLQGSCTRSASSSVLLTPHFNPCRHLTREVKAGQLKGDSWVNVQELKGVTADTTNTDVLRKKAATEVKAKQVQPANNIKSSQTNVQKSFVTEQKVAQNR